MTLTTAQDTPPLTAIIGGVFLILEFALISQTAAANHHDSVLWNAALHKPAYLNNVHSTTQANIPVDGDLGTDYYVNNNYCFHSANQDPGNWWMVDLMSEYLVEEIILTPRIAFGYRLAPVEIDLFLSDPRDDPAFPWNTNGVQCRNLTTQLTGSESFECLSPSYARYVKLLRRVTDYFQACEVEVMVSKKRQDPDSVETVSKLFHIVKDSTVGKGIVVENIVTSSVWTCVQLCAMREERCRGFYWTEETRDCQLLFVKRYDTGSVVTNDGTDFYLEHL